MNTTVKYPEPKAMCITLKNKCASQWHAQSLWPQDRIFPRLFETLTPIDFKNKTSKNNKELKIKLICFILDRPSSKPRFETLLII